MIDNKSSLLAAALQLFAERGYDAVGVQEIADAVHVGKPTLYHYFGNKEGLLAAIAQAYFGRFLTDLEQATRERGALEPLVDRVTQCYFRFASAHPEFYRLLLAMLFSPPKSAPFAIMVTHAAKPFALLEAVFAELGRDRRDMPAPARFYAATLIGLLNHYIALYLNGHAKLDARLRALLLRQFIYGATG